jgi:hypothetical protein
MQEIIIDISPTGDIKLEGNNIEGPDCKKLTEGIEEALGVVTASKKKPGCRSGSTPLAAPKRARARYRTLERLPLPSLRGLSHRETLPVKDQYAEDEAWL